MENIDDIFRAALQVCLKPWGAKSKLACEVEISSSYLWKLLNGSKYGTDETRRRIAAALGYSGSEYESFLNIGRCELGLLEESQQDSQLSEAEQWKEKYYAKVEELEETTKALLKALTDAQQQIHRLEKKCRQSKSEFGNTSQEEKKIAL